MHTAIQIYVLIYNLFHGRTCIVPEQQCHLYLFELLLSLRRLVAYFVHPPALQSLISVDSLEDVSINYIAQSRCWYLGGSDSVDWRCRFRGVCKILRTLPSGHKMKLDFFHGFRITGLTLGNLNWKKWAIVDFCKINLSLATKQRLYRWNLPIPTKMSRPTRVPRRIGCGRNGT
jgi:hypothetical protein